MEKQLMYSEVKAEDGFFREKGMRLMGIILFISFVAYLVVLIPWYINEQERWNGFSDFVHYMVYDLFWVVAICILMVFLVWNKKRKLFVIPLGVLTLSFIIEGFNRWRYYGTWIPVIFLLCFLGLELVFLLRRAKWAYMASMIAMPIMLLWSYFVKFTYVFGWFGTLQAWAIGGSYLFVVVLLILVVCGIVFLAIRKKISALSVIILFSCASAVYCWMIVLFGHESSPWEVGYVLWFLLFLTYAFINLKVGYKKKPKATGVTAEVRSNQMITVRMFCPSCGVRFPEGKKFCDQCGSELSRLAESEYVETVPATTQDAPSTGIAVLGFFVPLAGFIMWVTWKYMMPQKAKSAGKGALIGFITYAVLVAAYFVAYFLLLSSYFRAL